jgi:type IV pilus assembly protein PilC
VTTLTDSTIHAEPHRLQLANDTQPLTMVKTSLWTKLVRSHRAERLAMTRQVGMMLGAGTPVVPALGAAAAQTTHPVWRALLLQIRQDVEGGATLAAALGKHRYFFDPVYRAMVAAGEATAQLPAMFVELSVFIRRQQQVRNRLIGAMIYPCLLLLLSIGVSIGLLIGVLPRFTGLFAALGRDLPASTRALMNLSDWVLHYGWMAGLGVAGGVIGLIMYVRTAVGWSLVCRLALRMPGVGLVVRRLTVARLTRLLGLLLTSRVPLLETIDLTTEAMRHPAFRDFLAYLRQAVSDGAPMGPVFRDSHLVPPAVAQVVETGETSGDVGGGLTYVAQALDEDNNELIAVLSRMVEPAILLLLGLVVGGVAFSLFLPLFDIATAASGG